MLDIVECKRNVPRKSRKEVQYCYSTSEAVDDSDKDMEFRITNDEKPIPSKVHVKEGFQNQKTNHSKLATKRIIREGKKKKSMESIMNGI